MSIVFESLWAILKLY